jgi:hypothetical protein
MDKRAVPQSRNTGLITDIPQIRIVYLLPRQLAKLIEKDKTYPDGSLNLNAF